MSWVGVALAAVSAVSAHQASKAAETQNKARARQEEINAGQEKASGQRRANEEDRQRRLVQSGYRAASGSSGLSFSDAGSMAIRSDIDETGYLRSANALHEGDVRARQRVQNANDFRYKAKLDKQSATMALVTGAVSMGEAGYKGVKARPTRTPEIGRKLSGKLDGFTSSL